MNVEDKNPIISMMDQIKEADEVGCFVMVGSMTASILRGMSAGKMDEKTALMTAEGIARSYYDRLKEICGYRLAKGHISASDEIAITMQASLTILGISKFRAGEEVEGAETAVDLIGWLHDAVHKAIKTLRLSHQCSDRILEGQLYRSPGTAQETEIFRLISDADDIELLTMATRYGSMLKNSVSGESSFNGRVLSTLLDAALIEIKNRAQALSNHAKSLDSGSIETDLSDIISRLRSERRKDEMKPETATETLGLLHEITGGSDRYELVVLGLIGFHEPWLDRQKQNKRKRQDAKGGGIPSWVWVAGIAIGVAILIGING
uniref:hypothetical protein n=1 Tax=Paracoccus sp. TRP TaxID=412597 RepID=UPI00110FDA00|nr:hypothetical protein [Paracoccus sp. TRP]